jgi:hypothetical protein
MEEITTTIVTLAMKDAQATLVKIPTTITMAKSELKKLQATPRSIATIATLATKILKTPVTTSGEKIEAGTIRDKFF